MWSYKINFGISKTLTSILKFKKRRLGSKISTSSALTFLGTECVIHCIYCFRYLNLRRDTESVVSDADEISALSSRITSTLNTLEVFDHATVTELMVRADFTYMYITMVLYTMINANYWKHQNFIRWKLTFRFFNFLPLKNVEFLLSTLSQMARYAFIIDLNNYVWYNFYFHKECLYSNVAVSYQMIGHDCFSWWVLLTNQRRIYTEWLMHWYIIIL